VKYDLDVDPEADNNSHALVLDLVGRDRDVLDVGCATGYLARALVAQGCTVTGVELDEDAARQAAPHLAEVRLADLDRTDLARLGLGRRFDVVVFADVLEHLKDPLRALRASVDLLRPGGRVVVSIPNVAHGSVRLALLDGRFDYREIGLLDDTHIRFFTRSTLLELLTAAGLVPSDVRRTTAGVFATEIPVDPTRVPEVVLHDLERDDDAETYQFVLSAVVRIRPGPRPAGWTSRPLRSTPSTSCGPTPPGCGRTTSGSAPRPPRPVASSTPSSPPGRSGRCNRPGRSTGGSAPWAVGDGFIRRRPPRPTVVAPGCAFRRQGRSFAVAAVL
jgi:2-polyprenyl-3-methyl-5-hydroxy-6-metoxy-1,4-benzoquinol methylase